MLSNILNNCYFRQFTEGGNLWVQQVSTASSTKEDVIQLGEMLDTKLQQRRAKRRGICPIRSELYSQCFGKVVPMDQRYYMFVFCFVFLNRVFTLINFDYST